MTRELLECGRPIRKRYGVVHCVLPAGHRDWWCQSRRALDAAERMRRVDEVVREARAVLGALGVGLGRRETERWIYDALWRGEVELP